MSAASEAAREPKRLRNSLAADNEWKAKQRGRIAASMINGMISGGLIITHLPDDKDLAETHDSMDVTLWIPKEKK